jgi:hypothetical protein
VLLKRRTCQRSLARARIRLARQERPRFGCAAALAGSALHELQAAGRYQVRPHMQEAAFTLTLILGVAAFSLVPSAFFFRAQWRAGGSRRYFSVAAAVLLAAVAGGLSLFSPLEFAAQSQAWLAFFIFWLLLVLLAATIWLLARCFRRLGGTRRGAN